MLETLLKDETLAVRLASAQGLAAMGRHGSSALNAVRTAMHKDAHEQAAVGIYRDVIQTLGGRSESTGNVD